MGKRGRTRRRRRDARGDAAAPSGDALHPRGLHPDVLPGRDQPRALSAAGARGRLLDDRVVPALEHARARARGASLPRRASRRRTTRPRGPVRRARPDALRALRRARGRAFRWLVARRVPRSLCAAGAPPGRGASAPSSSRASTPGSSSSASARPRARASSAPWTSCAASTRRSATRSGADHVRMTLANIGNPRVDVPGQRHLRLQLGPARRGPARRSSQGKDRLRIDATSRSASGSRLAARLPRRALLVRGGRHRLAGPELRRADAHPGERLGQEPRREPRRSRSASSDALERIPELRDVHIPLALDYPTLDVNIDRERAGQLGLTVDRIGKSLVVGDVVERAHDADLLDRPGDRRRLPGRSCASRRTSIQSIEDARRTCRSSQDGLGAARYLRDVADHPRGDDAGRDRPLQQPAHGPASPPTSRATTSARRPTTSSAPSPSLGAAAARAPPSRCTGRPSRCARRSRACARGSALAVVVVLLMLAANFQSLREPLVVLLDDARGARRGRRRALGHRARRSTCSR